MRDIPILTLNCDNGLVLTTSILEGSPTYQKRANWSQTSIQNRSAPVIGYENSGPLSFSFSTSLYALSNAQSEVTDPSKAILSIVAPKKPGTVPPPICYLTYKHFMGEMFVCESVQVADPSDVWSPEGQPMHSRLTITLLELDLYNKSSDEYLSTSLIKSPYDAAVLNGG